MKKNQNSYLLLLILFLIACQPESKEKSPNNTGKKNSIDLKNTDKQEFYNFEVRDALNMRKELFLNNFTNEIKYIPLETTPACLLSKVKKVEMTNNYIFILDSRNGYYKFDKEGKFIQKIGKKGNGPGEYGMVFYSAVIEKVNEILLYCYPRSEVCVYDLETGAYKGNFKLSFENSGFVEFPPEHITCFVPQSRHYINKNEIYICNLKGQPIDSITESRLPFKWKKDNANGGVKFYRSNNSLLYMYGFYDTIYTISRGGKKQPYISLGLKNKIKSNDIKIKNLPGKVQYPDFLSTTRIKETDSFFFLTVVKGYGVYYEFEGHTLIYDKSTAQLTYCSRLVNNIDGGMPFWPAYIFNNKELVDVYTACQIIEHSGSKQITTKRSEKFNRLVNSLKIDDNPVLAIIELK